LTGCVKGNVNIDFQNIDDVEMNVEILLPKSFYNSYATDLNTINNIYDTSELKNISNYSLENLKDMGLEVNLNIIMPGEIIKTNVGKINNNKVQINLLDLLTQDKISTISLVSKEKTNNSFVINFIVIIILIFILYRIIRKSK